MIYRYGNSKGVPYSDPQYEGSDYFCECCGEEGAEDDFIEFQGKWLCEGCKEETIEKNRDEGCPDYQWFPFWRMDGKISNPVTCNCEHCLYDGLCAFTQPECSHEAL